MSNTEPCVFAEDSTASPCCGTVTRYIVPEEWFVTHRCEEHTPLQIVVGTTELERLRRIADAASEVRGNWCGWGDTGTNRQDFEDAMLVLQARLDGWEETA